MKKKINNKKIIKLLIIISIITIIALMINEKNRKDNEIKKQNQLKEEMLLKNKIESHYNKYVKVKYETDLYNEKEELIGKINKNVELVLENNKISKDTKYFEINDFDNKYYIKYEAVEPINDLTYKTDRYKNYIVFNENIITSDVTTFYDENGEFKYSFNKSFNLPIIVNKNSMIGVEYNDLLLYIKKDNINKIEKKENTKEKNSTGIPVLNYHFVYEDGDKGCKEQICHSATQIKEHFSYIKDNKYFTPTMKELEMYIDSEIQLPKKSVVITFDDGGLAEVARKYVDMYELNATLFLITAWYGKEQFESKYFEIHSHGNDLHNGGVCPGGQGGAIKCLEENKLLEDLKTSREKLNNTTVFCYPFYEYNQYSIKNLKKAGFTMAFAGEYAGGKTKVEVGANKFELPRWVIVDYTTMNKFISYVNGGS